MTLAGPTLSVNIHAPFWPKDFRWRSRQALCFGEGLLGGRDTLQEEQED